MAKQKVALECLSYHATASSDDTAKLYKDPIPSADKYNLFRCIYYHKNTYTLFIFSVQVSISRLLCRINKDFLAVSALSLLTLI